MNEELKPEELAQLKAGLSNISELKQEVEKLKFENSQLRQQLSQQETKLNNLAHGAVSESSPTSRRRMLRRVGAAAASVVAAGVATTAGIQNATATNGDPLLVGNSGNNATVPTLLFYNGVGAGPGNIFVASDKQTTVTSTGFSASIAGLATGMATGVNYGVFGYHGFTNTNPTPGGAGVAAVSDSTNGWGLRTKGGRANVYLEPGGSAPASRSDAHFVGEMLVDSSGLLWYCVATGMPGVWRKIGGPGVQGNLNLLGAPDRFADTRDGTIGNQGQSGPFGDGTDIIFTIGGRTGRDSQTIPANAVSILGNITAITPNGGGLLKVMPSSTVRTQGTATVNFNTGFNTANSFTSRMQLNGSNQNGQIKVAVFGTTSVHFTVDVVGYYM